MVPVVDTVLIQARLVDGPSHDDLWKINSSDKSVNSVLYGCSRAKVLEDLKTAFRRGIRGSIYTLYQTTILQVPTWYRIPLSLFH